MANHIGYINTEDGDLVIKNGTFAKGNSQASETRRLLLARAGDYKFDPTIHVSMRTLLGATITPSTLRRVSRLARIQLEKDGMTVNEMSISPQGKVTVDAER